jgi:ADP-heptose:LPS heptosyltransferase
MVMNTSTIIYCKHGIGNIIMMTPAIRALASMDKSGKVDICLDSEWQDRRAVELRNMFSTWDIVEEVIEFPKQQFVKQYATWFYTRHAEYSQAFSIFEEKNKSMSNQFAWSDNLMHEIDFYMGHVRKLGFKGDTPLQWAAIDYSEPVLFNTKPTIALCNGGFGDLRKVKCWPYFPKLADSLKRYFGAYIIKLGWANELADVDADADYSSKVSIAQSAALLSRVDLFITTDTALMHVADALKIPMVAIFGGTLVSKNGPVNGATKILRSSRTCCPCQTTANWATCENAKCLYDVTANNVMSQVRIKLNTRAEVNA